MTSSTRMRSELLLLLACLSLPAFAAKDSKAEAREQVARALKAYDLGYFTDALAAYSEAYRLDARPAFLFNIAQCHRQLNEPERSAFFFKRYLSYFPEGKAPNEKVVKDLIAEMEAKVAAAEAKKADEAKRQAEDEALKAQQA